MTDPETTPLPLCPVEVELTETGATRLVKRACKVCHDVDARDPNIVSPSGLAHESGGYGVTDCGVDATGPDWWWAE